MQRRERDGYGQRESAVMTTFERRAHRGRLTLPTALLLRREAENRRGFDAPCSRKPTTGAKASTNIMLSTKPGQVQSIV
jgi:hypothetical protein